MIQPYRELIDAINRGHHEYVTFARNIGIDSELTKMEFMMMFMEYHKGILDGKETDDGEAYY